MLITSSVVIRSIPTSYNAQFTNPKPHESNVVSNKSHKPSREEMLTELESIRSSLLCGDEDGIREDDNDDIDSSDSAVPPASDLAETQRMPIITPEQLDEESTPSANNEKAPAMTVLPGQQSLFDEEKKEKQAAEAEAAAAAKETEASQEKTTERENPFLPKAIKQRLEMERSLYEREISEHTPLSKVATPAPDKTPQDALIDELVKRYLPKIEQELRERLREQLEDESEDS